jgi:hypothetical protein
MIAKTFVASVKESTVMFFSLADLRKVNFNHFEQKPVGTPIAMPKPQTPTPQEYIRGETEHVVERHTTAK